MAQKEFDDELALIDQREDLDALQKENLKATVRVSAQRRFEAKSVDIERDGEKEIDQALRDQRLAIENDRSFVKARGIGMPAAIIFILILIVLIVRIRREMKDIPSARSRRNP